MKDIELDNLFVKMNTPMFKLYLPTEEELKAEIERDVFELGLRVEDDVNTREGYFGLQREIYR